LAKQQIVIPDSILICRKITGCLTKRLKMLASFGLVELEESERIRGRTALVPKVSFDCIIPPAINLNDLSKAA